MKRGKVLNQPKLNGVASLLAPRFRSVRRVYISSGSSAGGIFPLIKAKLLLTARSTKYHMTIGYALQELEYVITL